MTTPDEFHALLDSPEGSRVEFKMASRGFHFVEHLIELGVLEPVGHGRGARLLLSRRFYRHLGKAGVYTRKRGLDRETNKALLVRHLRESGHAGCPLSELQQVLPAQSRDQLKRLLAELRREGRVRLVGLRRGARWLAGGGE
ncbi:MAG: hypothetical protein Q8R92_03080 [Deltaproteobacteria bacterium]|nr:hypothetical protein [Deltaproteobacteria bacterium]